MRAARVLAHAFEDNEYQPEISKLHDKILPSPREPVGPRHAICHADQNLADQAAVHDAIQSIIDYVQEQQE